MLPVLRRWWRWLSKTMAPQAVYLAMSKRKLRSNHIKPSKEFHAFARSCCMCYHIVHTEAMSTVNQCVAPTNCCLNKNATYALTIKLSLFIIHKRSKTLSVKFFESLYLLLVTKTTQTSASLSLKQGGAKKANSLHVDWGLQAWQECALLLPSSPNNRLYTCFTARPSCACQAQLAHLVRQPKEPVSG